MFANPQLFPLRLWPALTGLALATGCITAPISDPVIGTSYVPRNIYQAAPQLPPDVRRVAVLPLTIRANSTDLEAGREMLEPVLVSEMTKRKAFEVVPVGAEQLRTMSGRTSWGSQERLPAGLLQWLRDTQGCDAVFFCELTQYRPYTPVAIGWSLKLADCKEARILWAADELFDAGDPTVQHGARRYFYDHRRDERPSGDTRGMLDSPRWVGQYSVYALLASLPDHGAPPKVPPPSADKHHMTAP